MINYLKPSSNDFNHAIVVRKKMVEWELYYLTWQMDVYMPVGMYICLCRCTCIMDKLLEDRMLTEFFPRYFKWFCSFGSPCSARSAH